jgi:hypothetical protein
MSVGENSRTGPPEIIDITNPAEQIETTVRRRGVDPRAIAIVVVIAIATLLLVRPAANADEAGQEPGSQPIPTAEANDEQPSSSSPDGLGLLETGDPDLGGYSRLSGLGLRAVVTSSSHGNSVLLELADDGEGVTVQDVPALRRFAFDASGQWLAGMSTTEHGSMRQVLWAGPVGGDFEPVAIGVRSFSWHDSMPATLAWSGDDQRELTTVGLTTDDPEVVFETPERGRIRGWGVWGFALNYWNDGSNTALLSQSGDLIVSDLPGRFNGTLADGRVILSGSPASHPLLVDPQTGQATTAAWLGPSDYVWSLATATDGPTAALVSQEGVRADPFSAQVTVIDVAVGEADDPLLTLDAFTNLALSTDGEWIVLARQQDLAADQPSEILALNSRTGRTHRVAVPDLFDGREWVSALSIG